MQSECSAAPAILLAGLSMICTTEVGVPAADACSAEHVADTDPRVRASLWDQLS
jgi:hypothetical protein